jgi:hypothetical protein
MTTTQRNAIGTPATGLQVYNTTTNTNDTYNGTAWISNSVNGVPGAIQFSTGSAFSSDASNLFWDDTNNRLGVGTNAPTRALEVRGSALFQNVSSTDGSIQIGANLGGIVLSSANRSEIQLATNARMTTRGTGITFRANSGEPNGAVLGVVGSGSTSATISLLVQNSAGTQLFKVADDQTLTLGTALTVNSAGGGQLIGSIGGRMNITAQYDLSLVAGASGGTAGVLVASSAAATNSSAMLEVDSTTRGFLPPRMTTAQKNLIATPATGLMVFDTDLARPCFFNGATWITL